MGRFFFFAIAPLFYNMSIIASIYIFKGSVGLVGLGLGALVGGILQLLIIMLGLSALIFDIALRLSGKMKILRLC
jgi:peptidoglycan biosynthesis protein MviN/MurJ (putative lipid II flippase)